jgi:hypothetical protein
MSAHEFHTPEENRTLPENRPISSLLSDLGQEVTTLIQQELQLARAETSEKFSQVESGISALAIGGAVAFGGFLILLQTIGYGIADGLGYDVPQLWIGYLIVAVVTLIIGFGLLKHGQNNLKAKRLALQRTKKSLRRDEEMVKEQIHRNKYNETY